MTTLLVASTGGHLKELLHLHDRLPGSARPFRWVTFDTPQSRSSLTPADVDFVPFVGGRDPVNVLRNVPAAREIIRRHRPAAVVSTGSAVAIPFFALARAHRIPAFYIESAARLMGPSLSASIIGRLPGVSLYTQHAAWADDRWRYAGSVFDSFELARETTASSHRISKMLVTLGTYRGFSFRRLVLRLLALIPSDTEVVWQTGDTDVGGLNIEARYALPEAELSEHIRTADVVVAHAGVGTALAALELGVYPLLVPRRFHHAEHVDDHQVQVADDLARRGLAISCDADELTLEHLQAAGTRSIRTRSPVPPLDLSRPVGA